MLESAYKNKGFVNFIFESIARNAVLLMNIKNLQFLVMVIKSECLSSLIKIRVW